MKKIAMVLALFVTMCLAIQARLDADDLSRANRVTNVYYFRSNHYGAEFNYAYLTLRAPDGTYSTATFSAGSSLHGIPAVPESQASDMIQLALAQGQCRIYNASAAWYLPGIYVISPNSAVEVAR